MSGLLHPDHVKPVKKLAGSTEDEPIMRRAQILLLYHDEQATAQIASVVGLSQSQVRHWRRAYLKRGMGIFPDFAAEPFDEMPDATPQGVHSEAAEKKSKKKPSKGGKKREKREKKGKKVKKGKKAKKEKDKAGKGKGKKKSGKKEKKKGEKGANKKRHKTKNKK